MRTNINKLADKHIDAFLLAANTGNYWKEDCTLSDGTKYSVLHSNLFAHIDDRKRVIAYLRSLDLDPFKRGTKMPALIASSLANVSWSTIKDFDPAMSGARSMWD